MADELRVAAASDLAYCLEELHKALRRKFPELEIKHSSGSSGNFFAQIKAGAPFDVFLSADVDYPRALVAAGLADAQSLTPYALGRIVLWSRNERLALHQGLAALRAPGIRKIAIANPEHAPYGRAAREALQQSGLWPAVQPRLVLGENISQTFQFAQTGNADVGIVALSLVLSPQLQSKGHYQLIPAELHKPLLQAAVITRRGAANPWAARYRDFLRSTEARAVFERYGFVLPADLP
ncbi:MAG: molybdate ABC transporter substrate-binding protein [Moraxellaceae bacterium]|nr:molybdate ABC transporter substrate-binding protein [Moraxellaceae bacterium]